MEYKINKRDFILIRTADECDFMKKEIGIDCDENIALYIHFCERKMKKQKIDFEMVPWIKTEIEINYSGELLLSKLYDLFTEIEQENIYKKYMG